jgi:hypothetical protein
MKTILLIALASLLSTILHASPKLTSCISDDQMVAVTMLSQSADSEMIDLTIKSNNPNRPTEMAFPCRENLSQNAVKYTLLDSEFELLVVDLASGKGKLSKGQFGSPNPFIDVTCQ